MLELFAIRFLMAALTISAGIMVAMGMLWIYIGTGVHPALAYPLAVIKLTFVFHLFQLQQEE